MTSFSASGSGTGRGPFGAGPGQPAGGTQAGLGYQAGGAGPGGQGSGGQGSGGQGGGQQPPPPGSGSGAAAPGGQPPQSLAAILELAKALGSATQGQVSQQVTDAITQSLLAILGSGPSIAAFENLMSINAANGMMYYNAVDHQQKTNLLGMAMTAKCVRYMLDPPSYEGFAEAISGSGDPASHG